MTIVSAAAIGCTGFLLGRGFATFAAVFFQWRMGRFMDKKKRERAKAAA